EEVGDGVEHERGTEAEGVGRRLTAGAARRIGLRVAVADRDDVARTDEDVCLAELDPPLLLVPARRAQDQEEAVAVLLQLGTLVRLVRVLDGEIVQAELALHRAQLVLAGLEEADPDERAGTLRRLAELVEPQVGDPAAALVRRAVDDHLTLLGRFQPDRVSLSRRSG